MQVQIIETIAGTTLRTTWVSSGVTANPISSAIITGSETIINSVGAVASGDGHYHALHHIPTSGGWYVNEWIALIGVNTYINRQLVRATRLEVD